MKNSPSIVVITSLILALSLFLLTHTNAHTAPMQESSKPPTRAHTNPKHAQSPQNQMTNAPTNAPNNPKQESQLEPKSSTSPLSTTQNDTSSYHFANNFCLLKRLDVQSTFCLKVLRSSPASTRAKNNRDLLYIAAYSAIDFGNKTLLLLQKLSNGKNTAGPVIEECLSAYNGYITLYNVLVQEAKSEVSVTGYDAELAEDEINRCVKAVKATKNAEIAAQNQIALDYTMLTQNIADSTN